MPFIPHTRKEEEAMLAEIGVSSVSALFDEIPESLRHNKSDALPDALSEFSVKQLMQARAAQDEGLVNFAGAGAYEHHIPAAVWQITTRGEFYTAYTPYQAEASQGTLQLLYEFQSMMATLTGMEVANASLYDGATSLAESILMAVRANKQAQSKIVLLPESIHPSYREVVHTIVSQQEIEIRLIPINQSTGLIDEQVLKAHQDTNFVALIIPMPNFFGLIEVVDELTDWAHSRQALVIGVVNPLACALLKPPGEWGARGADIVCGEGQPLGIPLASGGPYFGFMTTKMNLVRQMPGRIVGRTVDTQGREGFALTLQAREQHIRRAKATSNICTNQGLLVTAATIHMSLMGGEGLYRAATLSHKQSVYLRQQLSAVSGIRLTFDGPFFHETVIQVTVNATQLIQAMAKHGYLAGVDISEYYPWLGQAILICATEIKTNQQIDGFVDTLKAILVGE